MHVLCWLKSNRKPHASYVRHQLNEPITIGEVTIHAGDFIVGDRDGVVVIPKDRIEEVLIKAKTRAGKEANTRAELQKGLTSLKIYGWDKNFGY